MPPRPHLDNLDIGRGLAALAVCLFHFAGSGFLPAGAAARFLAHGYLGFDAFFVLSGFVIPLSLHRSSYVAGDYPIFLRRRCVRLYPAFLASVALAWGLWYASSLHPAFHGVSPRFTVAQGLGNLTLTADLFATPWINPVYWTLAIELQFYLLIGLVFPWLGGGHPARRYAALGLWLLAPVLSPLPATVFGYAALFGLGIVAFLRIQRLVTPRECAAGLVACALVHGVKVDWPGAGAGLATALAILFLPPVTARPLAFLGTISYSLYLIHVPFGGKLIHLAERLSANSALRYGLLVLVTTLTVAAAWVFYRLVERPFHQLSRSIGARGTTRAG